MPALEIASCVRVVVPGVEEQRVEELPGLDVLAGAEPFAHERHARDRAGDGDGALPRHLSQREGRGHDLRQRRDLPPLVRALGPEHAAGAGVDEDRGRRADADVWRPRGAASRRAVGAAASAAARASGSTVGGRRASAAAASRRHGAVAVAIWVARRPNQMPAPAAASTTSSDQRRPSRRGSGVCGADVRPASERPAARTRMVSPPPARLQQTAAPRMAAVRTTAELREGFQAFFEEKGHLRCPSASLDPARRRPLDALHERRHAAADAVLPRPRDAAGAADDDLPEVLPHARHRRGRPRHVPPHVLRDARQLLVRPVLQGRRDRVRDRVHPGAPEARLGPRLGERPRRRSRVSSSAPTRRRSVTGSGSACRRSGSCRCRRPRTSGRSAAPGRAGPTPRCTGTGARRPAAATTTACPGCTRCERFLEFGNLVFMSYELHADGTLTELPSKNIDTGWGLERVARVVQDVASVYDTDGYQLIMDWVAEQSGVAYGSSDDATKAHRVLADHGRGMTFIVAEGVTPSNEGRGYVLRRVVRRAAQHGLRIGMQSPFLARPRRRRDRADGAGVSGARRAPRRDPPRARGRGGALRRDARARHGDLRGSGGEGRAHGRGRLRAADDVRLPDRADARSSRASAASRSTTRSTRG